jgi:hypothetical protein
MTKEEILEKCCDAKSTFLHLQNGNNVIDGDADCAFEAMDIYAKQEAIEFAEWASYHFDKRIINGVVLWKPINEAQLLSTEAIYNFYLKSKESVEIIPQ